jgi:hypothetical protein
VVRETLAVRNSDLISGGLMIIFGLVMIFVIVPIEISSTGEFGVDPAFFPQLLLWLVVAMGALLVVTRIRAPADPPHREPVLDRYNWFFIGSFTLLLVLAYIAIGKAGFVFTGVVMTAVLMFTLGIRQRNWAEVAGVSVAAPVVIYYALYHVFNVQLPSGSLFP